MPIYCFGCDDCGTRVERVLPYAFTLPACPSCGEVMRQLPTAPGMVFMDGEGGYPSRRKFVKGSAPYTTRVTKVWGDYPPEDKSIDYMGTTK